MDLREIENDLAVLRVYYASQGREDISTRLTDIINQMIQDLPTIEDFEAYKEKLTAEIAEAVGMTPAEILEDREETGV